MLVNFNFSVQGVSCNLFEIWLLSVNCIVRSRELFGSACYTMNYGDT